MSIRFITENLKLIAGGLFAVAAVVFGVQHFASESKPPITRIGIAGWGSNPEFQRSIDGFKESLTEHGFVEGENVEYIILNSETDLDRQRRIIEIFVAEKVDLIYTLTTFGTLVAKEVTSEIPIVFSVVTYPVESMVIDSLESSGNNTVGTRNYIPPSKQFFVFERIVPDIQRMAFVRRKGEPNSTNQYEEFKTMLSARGISLVDIAAVDLAEIREKLTAAIHGVDVIYSACDTLTHAGGEEIIIELSLAYGKPAFACNKEGILKGALAGNIGDFRKIGKISGEKAYHILRGSQPTWLETESPRDDYFIVNTDTAKRLGISIPVDVMKEAQEIVGNGTS